MHVDPQRDFQNTIEDLKTATQEFCKGSAGPTKVLWSNASDVTLMGGWGSYESTWGEVARRIDWAAARYLEGAVTFETVAQGEDGNLGYTVGIERYAARVQGSNTVRPFALRVTLIYRREGGAWKIIHRHADAAMEKIEAVALLSPK
jgi:SnoaL-like domain